MKKQDDSKEGCTKKELIRIIEAIDRDRYQHKMRKEALKSDSNNENNRSKFS